MTVQKLISHRDLKAAQTLMQLVVVTAARTDSVVRLVARAGRKQIAAPSVKADQNLQIAAPFAMADQIRKVADPAVTAGRNQTFVGPAGMVVRSLQIVQMSKAGQTGSRLYQAKMAGRSLKTVKGLMVLNVVMALAGKGSGPTRAGFHRPYPIDLDALSSQQPPCGSPLEDLA